MHSGMVICWALQSPLVVQVIAVFPGKAGQRCWLHCAIEQGHMLGSAIAYGQVEPQAMSPGLMGPLAGFYIQSKLCYDQIGPHAVPFDHMGLQVVPQIWVGLQAMLCNGAGYWLCSAV